MENPLKMDDWGGKPTIFGNSHIYILYICNRQSLGDPILDLTWSPDPWRSRLIRLWMGHVLTIHPKEGHQQNCQATCFFVTFYTLHRTISYQTHLECFKPLPLKKTQKKTPCVPHIGCHVLSQDTKQGEGSLLWQLLAPRNWQDSKSTCEMWENPIPRLECGRWYVHETPRTCNMYLLKYLYMQISTQQKSL